MQPRPPRQGDKNRAAILAYVAANPGCSMRSVLRATSMASGTCFHHIHRLIRLGHLIERKAGVARPLFLPAQAPPPDGAMRFLVERGFGALREYVAAHPLATQKTILDAFAASHGWPRSTTQNRLARLVAVGSVSVALGQRGLHYAVAPAGRLVGLRVPTGQVTA